MENEEVGTPGEALSLELTPAQQAQDIERRMNEFNAELDPLCKKHGFVITVVRQDLPNGFIFQPQLVDTKFAPKAPVAPMKAEAPQVEVTEPVEEVANAVDEVEAVDPSKE
jgi:hypothetical protein